MRILLVDDEVDFVSALAERLSLRGIEADWVSSGYEALKITDEKPYDLVVVDLKMPGIGGQEVITRLMAKRPDQKFIILSGHAEGIFPTADQAADKCLRLIKPTSIETLLEMIQKVKDS